MKVSAFILCMFLLGLLCGLACYKGDPGRGNTDYPPLKKADGGRDGAR